MVNARRTALPSGREALCNPHTDHTSYTGRVGRRRKEGAGCQSDANSTSAFSPDSAEGHQVGTLRKGFSGVVSRTVAAVLGEARPTTRKRVTWTLELVDEMLVRSTGAARDAAVDNLACWRIDDDTRSALIRVMGAIDGAPTTLASDMTTRLIAGRQLVASILEIQVAHPERHWYHVTMVDDRRRTPERRPSIDLSAIKKTARAMMARAGINDWFGVVEILPLVNCVRGRGRLLCPHVHILFWTHRPIEFKVLERQMRSSCRLETSKGAPTVTISERRGVAEVAHAVAYLLKGTDRGSNEYTLTGRPDRPRMRDAAMRGDQALRIIEILSHVKLTNLMMSSGTGRSEFVAPVRRALKQSGCRSANVGLSADLWAGARTMANKTRQEQPYFKF